MSAWRRANRSFYYDFFCNVVVYDLVLTYVCSRCFDVTSVWLFLQVLVIVPTRELCQQVCDVANQFGRPHGIRATAVFGGSSKSIQMQKLREGKLVIHSSSICSLRLLDPTVMSCTSCCFYGVTLHLLWRHASVLFLSVKKVFLPGQWQKVVKTWQKWLFPAKTGKKNF